MRTRILAAATAATLWAGAFAASPAHADAIPGTSVSIATVRFAPSSNAISDAAQTALASARWRARAAAGIVITSYTKTSSSTPGALRAGRVRSGQRARKVYAQLNVNVPVTYRLYAAKVGSRAKNAVTVTASGFEATLSDCAAYTGVKARTIRIKMGLATDGTQDAAISTIALAPSAGAALTATSGLDLLCGGPSADTLDVSSPLQNADGPGVDLMLGAGGADAVALVDGGVFNGGSGADALAALVSGVFEGSGGVDALTAYTGGCVSAVETLPGGALLCL